MAQRDPAAFVSRRKGFALDRGRGKLFGVCAGIGHSLGVDPVLVRLVFALGAVFGFGLFAVIYLAIALIAD